MRIHELPKKVMDIDPPKTRRETKKSAKDKRVEVYSTKHVRLTLNKQLK